MMPAILPCLVVGQIMEALLSGKYDLNKTAIIMSQTGGGCRATNYIGFIRRALKKADMEHIPVISLNLVLGIREQSRLPSRMPDLLLRAAVGAEFGRHLHAFAVISDVSLRSNSGVPWMPAQKMGLRKVQKFVSAKHISIPSSRRMWTEIIRGFDAEFRYWISRSAHVRGIE